MSVRRDVVLRREDHRPEVEAGDAHALLGESGAHRVHGPKARKDEVDHREGLVDLGDARVGVERLGLGRRDRAVHLPGGRDAGRRIQREQIVQDRGAGPALADDDDRRDDIGRRHLGMLRAMRDDPEAIAQVRRDLARNHALSDLVEACLTVERVHEVVEPIAPRGCAEVVGPRLVTGLRDQCLDIHAPHGSGLIDDPLSNEGAAVDESESRRAFVDLLATLGEVADRYAGEEWGIVGPEDTAGALRSLAHLTEGGFLGHFEDDPAAPVFRPIVTSTRKSLGDNADALYFDTAVSGAHAYRVTGNLAGAVYTSFTIEEGAGDGNFPIRTAGVLNDSQFDVDAGGAYEIFLGGDARDRNWMPLTADAMRITTRHYWEELRSPGTAPVKDPTLAIEVLDASGPPPPLDDAAIAQGFRRVANYVRSRTLGIGRPGEGPQPAFVSREPHVFPPPVPPADHALAAIDASYSMAPYLLGPDDALVITARWPECRCANVNLWNRHMQTFDYAHRSVALNRAQTHFEADGSFRVVVAHRDPGVPNWLDTEGRAFGLVFWRYFLPEGPIEIPVAEVVAVDSLR